MTYATRRPQLLIQAGSQNQRVLRGAPGAFEGLHVSAHAGPSTVDFVRSSVLPKIVDPMTSLFRVRPKQLLDPKTGKLKAPVARLVTRYGHPFEEVAGKRKLDPEDLAGEAGVRAVEAILQHQRGRFGSPPQLVMFDTASKYFRWGQPQDEASSGQDRRLLLAPFFYVTSLTDPWLQVDLEMSRLALRERRSDEDVLAAVHFRPGLLTDSAAIDLLVETWAREPVDGYVVWPDGLKEEETTGDNADGLVRLIEGLAATGKPVTKLYGGFLSVLLWRRGLSGFSCGLNGTTYRSSFAFGGRPAGGRPPKKYYIPRLFRSYPLVEARAIIEGNRSLRCHCYVCEEKVGDDFAMLEEMTEPGLVESHFLNCRRAEIDRVVASDARQLRNWLDQSANAGEWARIADSDFPRQWARCVA